MPGFTYSIRFDAVRAGNVSKTLEVLERIDKRIETLNSDVNRFGNNLATAGNKGTQAFSGMSTSVGGLITKLGIAALTLNGINAAASSEGIEKSIAFATGSAENGAKSLQFLRNTTEGLGLDFVAATKGYKSLSASLKGTTYENKVNDIFYSLAEASSVMRLSQEEFNGAIVAMGQMASKGKVTAEELRGQLGERLPGAFQMAARAMGMTTMELDRQMSLGNVYADKFLPRLAAEMHRTYGSAVPEATQSAMANINRFKNSLYDLNVTFGQQLLPTVITFLKKYLIPGVKWIGQHMGLMKELAVTVGSAWLVYKTWTFWIGASTIATRAAALAQLLFAGNLGRAVAMTKIAGFFTGGFTAAMTLLNLVIAANPIGIIVTGLFLLGNAFMYAFNHNRNFRGGLEGTFRWLGAVGDRASAVVKMLSGNTVLAAQGLAEWTAAGKERGKAYTEGWNRGVGKFDAKNPGGDPVSGAFANVPGGGGGGSGSNDKIKAGIDSITGGGKQTKNVVINFSGKFFEDLVIQSQTAELGIQKIRDIVQREFLQVLNSANQVQ